MKKLPIKRRKCRNCKQFFIPDYRTGDRQKYCSTPACRRAGKAASQRRWLRKPANRNYFRGDKEVQRVREWRQGHPDYWKSKPPASEKAQPIAAQTLKPQQSSCNVPSHPARTLQEDCLPQDPTLVGLISLVTGSTLQEDIAATARQLFIRGRNILGQ